MIYGLLSGKETAVQSAITNLTEIILSVGNVFDSATELQLVTPVPIFFFNSYMTPALLHFFSVIQMRL